MSAHPFFKRKALFEGVIIDFLAGLAQLLRVMPHRAVYQHELHLVVTQNRTPGLRFDHQHPRSARRVAGKRGVAG